MSQKQVNTIPHAIVAYFTQIAFKSGNRFIIAGLLYFYKKVEI